MWAFPFREESDDLKVVSSMIKERLFTEFIIVP